MVSSGLRMHFPNFARQGLEQSLCRFPTVYCKLRCLIRCGAETCKIHSETQFDCEQSTPKQIDIVRGLFRIVLKLVPGAVQLWCGVKLSFIKLDHSFVHRRSIRVLQHELDFVGALFEVLEGQHDATDLISKSKAVAQHCTLMLAKCDLRVRSSFMCCTQIGNSRRGERDQRCQSGLEILQNLVNRVRGRRLHSTRLHNRSAVVEAAA